MPKVYLAVGHGKRPKGTFDPGAVAPDGTREYDVARRIADVADDLLAKAGVEVVSEVKGHGPTMDPNFVGSTAAVNGKGFDLAVSVHLDWHRAPRGGFGLYRSEAGQKASIAIAGAWAEAGLEQRPNTLRTELHFLNKTDCPAVIWEADRVGKDAADEAHVQAMGRALAAGVARAVGVDYRVAPAAKAAPLTAEEGIRQIGKALGHDVGKVVNASDVERVIELVKEAVK